MALIIGGHPRSGTSILRRICRDHPDMFVTGEFWCFNRINVPFKEHIGGLRSRWYDAGFIRERRQTRIVNAAQSGLFMARYILHMRSYRDVPIGVAQVEAVLHRLLPGRRIVGDKYPPYVFRLDTLCREPGLSRIIIYRDGRDVVSSRLAQRRRKHARQDPDEEKEDISAAKIAERWVAAIEKMQEHANELFSIRYEDFVTQPRREMDRLAQYLEVSPEGFRIKGIHARSIGKHRQGLRDEELAEVMEIAGPTLSRLGYL